jgi:phosphoribosyl-dephospho-CoA transferase
MIFARLIIEKSIFLTVLVWRPVKWNLKCQNLLDSSISNVKILFHTDFHEKIMKNEITSIENFKILTVLVWGSVKWNLKCQNLLDNSIDNVKILLHTNFHEKIMKYKITGTKNVKILTVLVWGPVKRNLKCQNHIAYVTRNQK